ncbi:MAG: T9SS type A sorting domain-containing protein [Flavitalea sp.]
MRLILLSILGTLVHTANGQMHIESIRAERADSISILRAEIKAMLFGDDTIPQLIKDNPPKTLKTTNYIYKSASLLDYERGTVTLENGFTSKITFFEPKVSNGLNIPIIYHTGHDYGIFMEDDFVNDRGQGDSAYRTRVVDYFLQRGYDVIGIDMPMFGDNTSPQSVEQNGYAYPMFGHDFIFYLKNPFYYFLAPVQSAIDYYQKQHNCNQFVMMGFSGGGWTTTIYSAIDPRITLSFPVAGSIPIPLRLNAKDLGDLEQYYPDLYDKYNYSTFYFLGAAGENRLQYQILNKKDNCCFAYDGNKLWVNDIKEALLQNNIPGKFDFYFDQYAPYHKVSSVAVDSISYHIAHDLAALKLKTLVKTVSSRANSIICDNDSVVLSISGPVINTFQWYRNGVKVPGANDSVFSAGQEGVFYPEVTNMSGAVIYSDSIHVKQKLIFHTPIITIKGLVLHSSATSANQWYYNGLKIQGEYGAELKITKPGRYTVRNVIGKCKSDFAEPFDYGITLFPNPASTQITIRVPSDLVQILQYKIISSNGVGLKQGKFIGEKTFNIQGYASGMYFIQLSGDLGFRSAQKFWVR